MIKIHLSTLLGARRWTQADLARATGIRPATINLLYHELADGIKFEQLELICLALNCNLEDLIQLVSNEDVASKIRSRIRKTENG